MKKMTIYALLLVSMLVHFGLTFKIIIDRLTCGIQVHCISLFNEVAGAALSFPLGLIAWLIQLAGLDPSVVVDAFGGGNIFILGALNSILAVLLLWRTVFIPIVRRLKQVHH
jgi:hypothetical protein